MTAYRDDLAAAHERIAELERERAEAVAPTREAARLAAFAGGAIAFLLDGDPLFIARLC
jgi:hypothetical protein